MGGGLNGQDVYSGRIIAQPVAFASNLGTRGGDVYDDGSCPTVRVGSGIGIPSPPAVAFDARQSDVIDYGPISGPLDTDGQTIGILQASGVVAPSLTASNDPSRSPQSAEVTNQITAVYAASAAVRRLTPRECERLQGFPDDWTLVAWRGKPASDGPRYRAIGNSMAVNCMEWLGQRIADVEART